MAERRQRRLAQVLAVVEAHQRRLGGQGRAEEVELLVQRQRRRIGTPFEQPNHVQVRRELADERLGCRGDAGCGCDPAHPITGGLLPGERRGDRTLARARQAADDNRAFGREQRAQPREHLGPANGVRRRGRHRRYGEVRRCRTVAAAADPVTASLFRQLHQAYRGGRVAVEAQGRYEQCREHARFGQPAVLLQAADVPLAVADLQPELALGQPGAAAQEAQQGAEAVEGCRDRPGKRRQ